MVFTDKKTNNKINILFILLCSGLSASDVISAVAKKIRTIMTSTLSANHKEKEKQVFRQISNFDTRMFFTF